MLIVANWKAYVDDSKLAKRLFEASKALSRVGHTLVLAPGAPFLGALSLGNRTKVQFASQDVSLKEGGAATGESTALMIKNVGATYAIVGHSERRALGETNVVVADKIRQAIDAGLLPIVCIGEHERDPEGKYLGGLREQVASALKPLTPKERALVVLAYEPLWAIGATQAIHPDDLHEIILYIRKVLAELTSVKGAAKSIVLYGGSVDPSNIAALGKAGGVQGFLIGRASVEPKSFTALLRELL